MMSDNAFCRPKSLEVLSHLEKNVDNHFSQRLEYGRGSN